MKKILLLCSCVLFIVACDAFFVSDRKPNGIAWGGGAFASPSHQLLDVGFMRLQGRSNEYESGVSFQFPALGIYGGNDHTSIGLLVGFTIYYREKTYSSSGNVNYSDSNSVDYSE